MSLFPSAFAFILVLSSAILVVVAYFAFLKRENPGGWMLCLLLLVLAEWSFAAAFEAAVTTIPEKILWSKISYLGIVNSPLLVLLFSFEFTKGEKIKKVWNFSPLFLIQFFFIGMAFTNENHHLIWTTFTPSSIPGSNMIVYGHGTWFWVMIVYLYMMLLVSFLFLLFALLSSHHIHRQQLFFSLVALTPPWIANLLYVFKLDPFFGFDVTPAAFTLTGLALAWCFFRFYFLDITPMARDQVIEEMRDGVLVLDSSNRIVDVNPAAQQMIGMDSLSIVGRNAGLVLATFLNGSEQLLDAAEANAEVYVENIGYLECRISSLQVDEDKRASGRMIVIQNITSRKKAEEALTLLNANLEEQVAARTEEIQAEKELSDAILRSVSDGIMMADPDLRIRYVNPAFTVLTGNVLDEVVGRHAIKVALGEGAGWVRQSIESNLSDGNKWQNEVTGCRKDGRTYDASMTAAPIMDAGGRITGYVFTLRDVSQRKSLERVRYKFMESMSHQFRTPVTVLNLYAHLLGHGDLSNENRRHLETIKNQIDRLTLLIQDIIEMANLDSGKAVSTWADVYIPALINNSVTDLAGKARAGGLQLDYEPVPIDFPRVKGDEMRISQALNEVLENAIVFTPSGGKVHVKVGIKDGDRRWVVISVEDSGPGIPEDEKEKVFERFFRGSITDSGHTVGTGLGLSIAQEIMLAHGGYISLESSSKGSTFYLWLPLS